MGTDAQSEAILDTCVLINFLRVDRAALLARHPAYRILITNHVRGEVLDHYPEQLDRLTASLSSKHICETIVDSEDEVAVFSKLIQQRRFGVGECSSIAAALVRNLPLATDDQTARKHVLREFPSLRLFDTSSIVVDLIRSHVLDVSEADALKELWAAEHRFRLTISSFSELL